MRKSSPHVVGRRPPEHPRVFFLKTGGCCSLVVKVTDSWLTCHELEPSTSEDPPCKGDHCLLNLSRLYPTVHVMWKLGEGDTSSGIVLVI
ncbi:hypothetical protein TNCV_1613581 [Trichonephila clavipes]|nr:hypothetical protein TNCV_1613581 [Trichonephila clavipes]